MPVRIVEDIELVKKISESHLEEPVLLWLIDESDEEKTGKAFNIAGADTKEMVESILNILPNPQMLNKNDFEVSIMLQISSIFYCLIYRKFVRN